MEKTVYILIGPKGAGKSHLGRELAGRTAIHFLRVEPIWLSLDEGQDGWAVVEQTIDTLLRLHDRVMIESLGCGEGFERLRSGLESKYRVRLIRVYAALDECLRRVRTRSREDHIAVSDDQVEEYNRIAARVEYDWDLVIDNDGPAAPQEIDEAARRLELL